ncbi:hypothetical protein Tdes44962_MAKER06849 [Teratosphaeria destructans]|uniref:Uncharacterized protein n=1 Tax=Teratosphaeria destructans TaxID=418781 RepID=A0A9W7T0B8_9PEZI|nr:hypothetical protein Tdes44962_MAKER06849 [Teratosphaeria destructans]
MEDILSLILELLHWDEAQAEREAAQRVADDAVRAEDLRRAYEEWLRHHGRRDTAGNHERWWREHGERAEVRWVREDEAERRRRSRRGRE